MYVTNYQLAGASSATVALASAAGWLCGTLVGLVVAVLLWSARRSCGALSGPLIEHGAKASQQ